RFEGNDCTKGCLIGNLSLEMSDQFEKVRERLEQSLQRWTKVLSGLLLQAQEEKAIPTDLDPEMLAESLISSFQGALLRSKVKKSSEPLKNFTYLYFDRFLTRTEEAR
ncbi:MAG: TetR family transcriptional regulator, partial [Deltaproteobacteria bacterium]|nr:TetR family transcriptional regulator [Deltaproteobacteria bacterium]